MTYASLPPAEVEAIVGDLTRLRVLHYVFIACLTVCVWDWILAISDEVRMIRIGSGRPWMSHFCTGVYMVLRVSALGWLITNFLNAVAPPVPTNAALASMVFDCLALPSASWLFYIRLSAVYLHDKKATTLFGLLWAGVLAYFVYDTISLHTRFTYTHAINPGKTDAFLYIINAIYDTLAYLAVSWQLSSFSINGDSCKHRVMSFAKGDGLLDLSRALLRSGQIYYFTTVAFGVASVACMYSERIPIEFRGMVVPMHVSIASILGCRIFRELKLGIIPHNSMFTNLDLGALVFAEPPELAEPPGLEET
ncbi:hypothetical protein FIBSPDRAFT_951745 [Athelia psychrophila]|uniref:DUF6533 domain-containing protein n=1 Tax=Athelia psychrophila TaxID=1759441 RepID=A0A166MCE0_9AGAM|nr:hypothetical protein FIBSPDRAFT_951745 [Fibularhizoctonia sp. CBS 109695]